MRQGKSYQSRSSSIEMEKHYSQYKTNRKRQSRIETIILSKPKQRLSQNMEKSKNKSNELITKYRKILYSINSLHKLSIRYG